MPVMELQQCHDWDAAFRDMSICMSTYICKSKHVESFLKCYNDP